MSADIVSFGNATINNVRREQILEHFGRKLDAVLADGAADLSVLFVVYGHKSEHMSNQVSWDVAEGGGVPVRMMLTDASMLLFEEARQLRANSS